MSLSDLETAIATGLKAAPFVRDAMPADYPAIRGVVIAGLVPRALLATLERLAREAGAPVFAFHTASFMARAIAVYERLGYRRAPEFDFDMAARYSGFGAAPIVSTAYLRHLTPLRACA